MKTCTLSKMPLNALIFEKLSILIRLHSLGKSSNFKKFIRLHCFTVEKRSICIIQWTWLECNFSHSCIPIILRFFSLTETLFCSQSKRRFQIMKFIDSKAPITSNHRNILFVITGLNSEIKTSNLTQCSTAEKKAAPDFNYGTICWNKFELTGMSNQQRSAIQVFFFCFLFSLLPISMLLFQFLPVPFPLYSMPWHVLFKSLVAQSAKWRKTRHKNLW